MPRYARPHLPGVVHHIIARFVNKEFRMDSAGIRHQYLRRLGLAAARCDWTILAYALMSSHIHICAVAGTEPSDRLMRPVHAGFARWLNRVQARLGPVFADRHKTVACDDAAAGTVIAYIHNNPVRARVVGDAADSDWTSHGLYLRRMAAPDWLDTDAGLRLCGFDASDAGRAGFDAYVRGRREHPRDPMLTGEDDQAARRAARALAGAPVEISAPRLEGRCVRYHLQTRRDTPLRPVHDIAPRSVIHAAARCIDVDAGTVTSTCRRREVVAARRLALRVWRQLGRPQIEMACALGISDSAASQLLRGRRASTADGPAAEDIARQLVATELARSGRREVGKT